MLNEEMRDRKALYETRFRVLSERSGDSRKSGSKLENEIHTLQAGEERRGSSASPCNGCCFDPAISGQVFAFGETRGASSKQFMQQEFVRQYRNSGAPEQRGRLGKRLG